MEKEEKELMISSKLKSLPKPFHAIRVLALKNLIYCRLTSRRFEGKIIIRETTQRIEVRLNEIESHETCAA